MPADKNYSLRSFCVILVLAFFTFGIIIIQLIKSSSRSRFVSNVFGYVTEKNQINNDIGKDYEKFFDPKSNKQPIVLSGSTVCSKIGRNIINSNGSVVDAAVGILFCQGVVEPHRSGLGGGFLMLLKIKNKVYSLNALEMVPQDTANNSDENMKGSLLQKCSESRGKWKIDKESDDVYSKDAKQVLYKRGWNRVAVPGEPLGIMVAHKRFGTKSWTSLIEPSINLCINGFKVSRSLANHIEKHSETIKKMNDLRAKWSDVINFPLNTANDLYYLLTPTLPASGIVIQTILNIMMGYNNQTLREERVQIHKMIEAMKYSFSYLNQIVNKHITDQNIFKQILSRTTAELVRNETKNGVTFDPPHYTKFDKTAPQLSPESAENIMILTEDGDAVIISSSIGAAFGAGVEVQGVLLNNKMALFGDKIENDNMQNSKQLMAVTPFSPSIVLDVYGNLRLMINANGNNRALTTIALVIFHHILLEKEIGTAFLEKRYHHQLIPNILECAHDFEMSLINFLTSWGHQIKLINETFTVANAIANISGKLYTVSDDNTLIT